MSEKDRQSFISTCMKGYMKKHYSALEILQLSENCEKSLNANMMNSISDGMTSYNSKQINNMWQIFCNEYSGNDD